MALIQWREAFDPFRMVDSFRDLRDIQQRMSALLEGRLPGAFGVERGTSTFPPLDIRQDVESVYVVAEVPGVSLESLDVSITGDTLTIKGERKAGEVPEQKYHRRERPFGHFTRLVSLPARVDAEKIHATLKDGILTIALPKAESAKPRQIKVAQS
jgi:HSP20 family protein